MKSSYFIVIAGFHCKHFLFQNITDNPIKIWMDLRVCFSHVIKSSMKMKTLEPVSPLVAVKCKVDGKLDTYNSKFSKAEGRSCFVNNVEVQLLTGLSHF